MSKISVVITTYQKLPHLMETIEAWSKQTVKPHELIVVDDGSTHPVLSQLRHYEDLPITYVWQQDRGYRLASAMNKGVSLASGDIIVKADDDILVEPDFLEKVSSFFSQQPAQTLMVPLMHFADKETKAIIEFDKRTIKPDRCVGFYGGCVAVPKKAFAQVGLFDAELFDGRWGAEDTEWAYRAIQLGYRLIHNKEIQVLHLDHPKRDGWQWERQVNARKMLEKHGLRDLSSLIDPS